MFTLYNHHHVITILGNAKTIMNQDEEAYLLSIPMLKYKPSMEECVTRHVITIILVVISSDIEPQTIQIHEDGNNENVPARTTELTY